MASIAGIACTFCRGHIPANRPRVRVWQVPGVNGYGAKILGLGESEFRILVEIQSTSLGANTFYAAMEALQGSIVTIINDWGNIFTNCLLTRIGPPQKVAQIPLGARMRVEIDGVRK